MNPLDRHPTLAMAVFVVVALVAPQTALAQGTDEQWEITSKMEMPGMPMAMPAQVTKASVGKNAKDDDYIPKQGDCKVVDSKRVGNKLTYKMTCAGSDPSTVDGEALFGTGTYDGKMRMTMTKTNQSMQMTYSGKRVGSCTAPK